MKRIKIYISLPITGHDIEEVKSRAKAIKRDLSSEWSEVITPFDVCPEQDLPYSFYMGRDIEALLNCDAVFFTKDWESSRGCRLEHAAAEIFSKRIFCENEFTSVRDSYLNLTK